MCSSGAVRFVDNSPLEEDGFEPSVPRKRNNSLWPAPVRSPAIRLPQQKHPPSTGTDGSKTSPSSKESAANLLRPTTTDVDIEAWASLRVIIQRNRLEARPMRLTRPAIAVSGSRANARTVRSSSLSAGPIPGALIIAAYDRLQDRFYKSSNAKF